MNKRTRFVILLAVLAVCFAFLWTSISWYYGTPKEVQALALGSLENIKDYATAQASEDVLSIKILQLLSMLNFHGWKKPPLKNTANSEKKFRLR